MSAVVGLVIPVHFLKATIYSIINMLCVHQSLTEADGIHAWQTADLPGARR